MPAHIQRTLPTTRVRTDFTAFAPDFVGGGFWLPAGRLPRTSATSPHYALLPAAAPPRVFPVLLPTPDCSYPSPPVWLTAPLRHRLPPRQTFHARHAFTFLPPECGLVDWFTRMPILFCALPYVLILCLDKDRSTMDIGPQVDILLPGLADIIVHGARTGFDVFGPPTTTTTRYHHTYPCHPPTCAACALHTHAYRTLPPYTPTLATARIARFARVVSFPPVPHLPPTPAYRVDRWACLPATLVICLLRNEHSGLGVVWMGACCTPPRRLLYAEQCNSGRMVVAEQ